MEIRNTATIMDLRKSERNEAKPAANASTLAMRLRRSRQFKGWSQQGLANRAATSQAVIQKIENGKSLRPRNVEAIAHALEVEPAWLMFGSNGTSPVSEEAIRVAKAWAALKEPDRGAVRDNILRLTKHN